MQIGQSWINAKLELSLILAALRKADAPELQRNFRQANLKHLELFQPAAGPGQHVSRVFISPNNRQTTA